MLIYEPNEGDESESMWTKDVLISIREFEKDIKADPEYSITCYADQIPGGTPDEVDCKDDAFQSVLDLFILSGKELTDLEDMTDAELYEVLQTQVKDSKVWKDYKTLFDNQVDPDSTEKISIRYMRSLLTQAGPIKDGDKRYESIKDGRDDQDTVATDF